MSATIKPIAKYPGAKWLLADWIISCFPPTPFYVEPYCGSAAVWFSLWAAGLEWPRYAVLNDLEGEIGNLFRVMRDDLDRLCHIVALTPWSRAEYLTVRDTDRPADEPTERARRYLVQLWQGHGAATGGRSTVSWRHQGVKGMRANVWTWKGWNDLPERLAFAAQALKCAEIETRPALNVIAEYQAPDVLLYVDPPYVGSTRNGTLYRYEQRDEASHTALLDVLELHPGPVVLSGYHCELYDTRLAHWRAVEREALVEKGNIRTEVLWLNQACIDRLGHGPLFEELSL